MEAVLNAIYLIVSNVIISQLVQLAILDFSCQLILLAEPVSSKDVLYVFSLTHTNVIHVIVHKDIILMQQPYFANHSVEMVFK